MNIQPKGVYPYAQPTNVPGNILLYQALAWGKEYWGLCCKISVEQLEANFFVERQHWLGGYSQSVLFEMININHSQVSGNPSVFPFVPFWIIGKQKLLMETFQILLLINSDRFVGFLNGWTIHIKSIQNICWMYSKISPEWHIFHISNHYTTTLSLLYGASVLLIGGILWMSVLLCLSKTDQGFFWMAHAGLAYTRHYHFLAFWKRCQALHCQHIILLSLTWQQATKTLKQQHRWNATSTRLDDLSLVGVWFLSLVFI